MLHISTRGEAPPLNAADAMLTGLARDGGLYLPEAWPHLERDTLRGFAGQPYAAVALEVVSRLAGDAWSRETLKPIVDTAYAAFRHEAVAPLSQVADGVFALELFHGPTLAFKDVAMRLLAGLMDAELSRRDRRATIVGATSGDTGSAAIDAFKACEAVDVFILYPHGRVSAVQRRQMTASGGEHVHALAVDGTFDDCQAIVKALFADDAFRDGVAMSGVNSINWTRIAAQVTYYVTSAVALGAPDRPVSFSVPTGNFGNVLAGYVAKRMGVPIDRFVVATNANDVLARFLCEDAGDLREVVPSNSPSMDIQVSSNFERLMFEALDRDAARLRAAMDDLRHRRRYRLPTEALARIRAEFGSASFDDEATLAEMRRAFQRSGLVLDPHTAIGVAAGRAEAARVPSVPVIALATAHPAKFPDAVEAATGRRPALPPHLADLMTRPERMERVPNDVAAIGALIRERARAGKGSARWGAAA